jgi:hypothetical protein
VPAGAFSVVPYGVDAGCPGPRPAALVARHGLARQLVVLHLGAFPPGRTCPACSMRWREVARGAPTPTW